MHTPPIGAGTKPIPNTESQKTATLYLLFVATFPIMLPTLIAVAVSITLYVQSIGVIAAESPYAAITYPISGEKVPEKFQAKGFIKQKPDNTHIFISGATGGLYWPKIGVTNENWTVDLSAPGALGYKFDLVVIAVSAADKTRIEQWFTQGRDTGKYPGLQGFENLQTLAKVKVER